MTIRRTHCLYEVNIKTINFSLELFPSRRNHKALQTLKEEANINKLNKIKFSSITCGAGNKHNLNSLMILIKRNPNRSFVTHIFSDDKSFHSKNKFSIALTQIGIVSLLLIKGDRYLNIQKRIDNERLLKSVRIKSLINIGSSYPDNHIVGSGFNHIFYNSLIKHVNGCVTHFTQLINHIDSFLNFNIKYDLSNSGSVTPGFMFTSKVRLASLINAKCGIYICKQIKNFIMLTKDKDSCYISRLFLL